MFYAERIEGTKIVEKGVFLSIAEFVPYRRAGWTGTKETNRAADAAMMNEGDKADAWWMNEMAAHFAEHGMSRALHIALANHCL